MQSSFYIDKVVKKPWGEEHICYHNKKKIGITLFSTPFSEAAVDYLEKLNCPFYKVASFEMIDHPLVIRIAKTKKPIILAYCIMDKNYNYNFKASLLDTSNINFEKEDAIHAINSIFTDNLGSMIKLNPNQYF